MPKTCIICGQRAGSGEHIFPATLGGRRTNKGIYCGLHNKGLGPLAAIISDQLKPINALLAVRPDHLDAAQPFEYTSPNGERLTIFDGSVARVSPALQRDQEPMHARLMLGGPDSLRAIAYIALTYFAHYFQEYARLPSLQPLKDFVLGTSENNHVWWEDEALLSNIPANPFEFGHTVAVSIPAATGEAFAIVSLFGSLTFGVAIAKLQQVANRSVVAFINPHADKARHGHDAKEERQDAALFVLNRPDPLHTHLERMVREGGGERRLRLLLSKIERWKFRKDMLPVLERLNEARTLAPLDRREEVKRVVEEQTQRVYRLMLHIVDQFELSQMSQPSAEIVLSFLKVSVALDASTESGLSNFAHACAISAMFAVAEELDRTLAQRDVDVDYLWTVFSAGYGAGIVGEAVFAPFRAMLGGSQT